MIPSLQFSVGSHNRSWEGSKPGENPNLKQQNTLLFTEGIFQLMGLWRE